MTQAAATTTPTETKQKPAYEVRLGRIKATLWANQGEYGTFYNVRVARIYKDAEGQWQESDSFGRDDLPVLQKVLDRAYLWQYEQDKSERDAA